MKRLFLLAAAALLLPASAAAPPAMQTPTGVQEQRFALERILIVMLRMSNNSAIADRDLETTMAIVADDYVLVAGSDAIVRSADDMRARWAETFANPAARGCVREPGSIEIGEHAGILRAAEFGSWRCPGTNAQGEAEPHGTYFAHWSKRGGEWRVVSDNYVTLGCRGPGC